jgi:hypothetical protein
MKTKGIFCLQGDCRGRLDRLSTVKPILKLRTRRLHLSVGMHNPERMIAATFTVDRSHGVE